MENKETFIIGQCIHSDKLQRSKELRRSMTPTEKKLWNRLRQNQLDGYHFRRQQIVAGFIIDFYCNQSRVVVEIDGGIHNTRRDYDAEREKIILAKGLKIIRITNEEVESDIDAVLERILLFCRDADK